MFAQVRATAATLAASALFSIAPLASASPLTGPVYNPPTTVQISRCATDDVGWTAAGKPLVAGYNLHICADGPTSIPHAPTLTGWQLYHYTANVTNRGTVTSGGFALLIQEPREFASTVKDNLAFTQSPVSPSSATINGQPMSCTWYWPNQQPTELAEWCTTPLLLAPGQEVSVDVTLANGMVQATDPLSFNLEVNGDVNLSDNSSTLNVTTT